MAAATSGKLLKIKDFKHGLGLSHVPTGVLTGQWQAYSTIAALAWNLKTWMLNLRAWRRGGDPVQAVPTVSVDQPSGGGGQERARHGGAEVASRRILPAVRHGSRRVAALTAGCRRCQNCEGSVCPEPSRTRVRQRGAHIAGCRFSISTPAGLAAFLLHVGARHATIDPINSVLPHVMPRIRSRTVAHPACYPHETRSLSSWQGRGCQPAIAAPNPRPRPDRTDRQQRGVTRVDGGCWL